MPGKRWLEAALAETSKTVLYVSHDRELLHRTATRVVTIEAHGAWVHGEGFATYPAARQARRERLADEHKRWEEEHQRLRQLMFTLRDQAARSPDMANRYSAMVTRLEKFEKAGPPPEQVVDQKVEMRLRGGRTGVRALTADRLELTGLMKPFDLEVFYGERVAVLGSNGSGKSHFLRLLADQPVAHTGVVKLGARVVPGWFAQTQDQPELYGRTLTEVLHRGDDRRRGLERGGAVGVLRRYELHQQADQVYDTLSGGQKARLQVLLLELSGCTMLLLDEPTDNLDLDSAEALEEGLEAFDGTVVAVTHDRWFARGFDRFLVFGSDGQRLRVGRAGVGRGPGRAGRGDAGPWTCRSGGSSRATGRTCARCGWRRCSTPRWPTWRRTPTPSSSTRGTGAPARRAAARAATRASCSPCATVGRSAPPSPSQTPSGRTSGGLAAVYVQPVERGAGLLGRLVDGLAAHAAAGGGTVLRLEVHEDNPRARAAYRRLGFVETGGRRPYPLGEGDELEMERALERVPDRPRPAPGIG